MRITSDVGFTAPDRSQAPTMEDLQTAATAMRSNDRGLLTTVAGSLGFGVVDFVDTVSSSLGFTDREAINRSMLTAIDSPGLNDFYHDTRGGIEFTSGIYGIVASDLIARRLTAPGSILMRGLAKLPYGRRVAQLDAQYANAMATVRNVDTALARRGAIGLEQYIGRATVDTMQLNRATNQFELITASVARNEAFSGARRLGFMMGARHAAATEGVMAVTLNQNSMLYFDSMSHNLFFGGLGIGIGGGLNSLFTSWTMRKFVNSDLVRREFAGALDPQAVEQGRLLWHGREVNGQTQVSNFLGGTITDRVTSLLSNASFNRNTPVTGLDDAVEVMRNRDRLATQHLQQAREEMQKVTTQGISTDGRTRFSLDSRGYGNHVDMMMHRDPGAFYGAEMVGGISDELTAFGTHQAHLRRIDEQIAEVEERLRGTLKEGEGDMLTDLRKRLEFQKRLTPMAAIDGELMPISEAQAIEGFVEPNIGFTPAAKVKGQIFGKLKEDSRGMFEVLSENEVSRVSLDTDFAFHMPKGRTLDNADHFDMLRLYRLGYKAVNQMAKFEGPLTLPKNANWFQLDMAEEILKINPSANIVWPKGLTRESAQIEALIQKSQAMKKWDTKVQLESAKAIKAGKTYDGLLSQIRVRYNLPRMTAYERGVLGTAEHPVEQLLRGISTFDPDTIRKMSLTEIKETVARFKRLGDVAPVTAKDVESLNGNSFHYMLDENGQGIKPLLVYKRPFEVAEWTTEHVAERMAANKMQTVATLLGGPQSPMTRSVTQSMLNSADFDVAARANELMDVQIQGSIFGSAPQTARGTASRSAKTSEWRDRDNPILLAATRVREAVTRQTRDFMKVAIEGSFGDVLGRINNPRNAASKLLINQFHSYRNGWDLMPKPVTREGGFTAFTLADTAANRNRFKQFFQRDMAEGQTLISPSGKEVVLDDLAMEAQGAFNAVTDLLREEKNTLLKAHGRTGIGRVDHFTPPPRTDGKFMGFVIGPDGKVVPGLSIVEDTQVAFNKARQAIAPELERLGMGYTFRTQDDIKAFSTIWDRAQMDFIDPGTTAIQPNKRSRGALSGNQVRLDAFEDSLKYLQDQFINHGDDLVETLFKEQINAAKSRGNIAAEMTRNNVSRSQGQKFRSVYDIYLENLQGRSKLNSEGSMVGGIYNRIEGGIDRYLDEATPGASKVWNATNAWIDKAVPWTRGSAAKRDFEKLTEKLGPYMPFENAMQMAERQSGSATPATAAKISGAINRFSAGMLLRFMEVAHPIMNLAGILNAQPSVIRWFTPHASEDAATFAARVGHVGNTFNLKDGRSVGVLDMGKLSSRAFKRAWSQKSHADYDFMVRNGYLTQEVAEFQRQFGSIQTKGSWNKFFTGDEHAKTAFGKKGIIGWGSILSDKSEDFSRSWGHMTGLELADNLGITGMEARHAFAHDVANKMIANYSPLNRPEIFQGAIGAPFGLFRSFIINYYQRLFRYAETGEYATLGLQFATQGALFGAVGLPGWKAASALLTSEDGSKDPTSAIWNRFGPEAGDWLASGALSNLPKLLGGEGVDLYSRGDTNLRELEIDFSGSPAEIVGSLAPGLKVMSQLFSGIGEALSAVAGKNPTLTTTQLAEIASNTIANRPIAGMIEQWFAGGNDTDRYGQLVSETATSMEHVVRLLGLRSMRQSNEVNAFYADRRAMEHNAANQELLRVATRSAIREGNFESLPGIYQQYMDNGGDPRYFRRWIRDQYESATSTRAQRQLETLLNNPTENDLDRINRLLDAGVQIEADENAIDPQEVYLMNQADELDQPTNQLGTYNGQMTLPDQTQRTPGF